MKLKVMVNLGYAIKGVLGVLFGLLVTVFGWYIISALSEVIPIGSLKAIFWIGIILYWICAVILVPLVMIMGGNGGLKGAIFGIGAFLIGYALSLTIYYTIGYLLEALEEIAPNSTFVGIGWLTVYLIWILSLIVAPVFLTVKDCLGDKEEEE